MRNFGKYFSIYNFKNKLSESILNNINNNNNNNFLCVFSINATVTFNVSFLLVSTYRSIGNILKWIRQNIHSPKFLTTIPDIKIVIVLISSTFAIENRDFFPIIISICRSVATANNITMCCPIVWYKTVVSNAIFSEPKPHESTHLSVSKKTDFIHKTQFINLKLFKWIQNHVEY